MQVTRIECTVGFTINTGDFQSVKAAVGMTAELDRNEDPDQAYAALRSMVLREAVAMGADAHPDRVRALLGGQASLPAPTTLPGGVPGSTTSLGAPAAEPATTKTRGRPKKDDAAKTNGATPPASTGEGLLGETTLGGLDGESMLGVDPLGDGPDPLGDGPAETPLTLQDVKDKMRVLLTSKGQPALLELLRKFGVAQAKDLPESKYREAFDAVDALVK